MGTPKDDDAQFDPLEALADIVTGDAFTFFDPKPDVVKEIVKNDAGTGSSTSEASGQSGRKGQSGVKPDVKPADASITPIKPPTAEGKAPGKQKQTEGGDSDGNGKEGDGKPAAS